MRRESLLDLVCPALSPAGPCRSQLALRDDCLLIEEASAAGAPDVIEGVLYCVACGAEYPILCGLPILLYDIKSYLRANFPVLVSTALQEGVPLSAEMRKYLERQGAHFSPTLNASAVGWHYGSPLSLSVYLAAHYDNLRHTAPAGSPLSALLEMVAGKEPHSVLHGILSRNLRPQGTALDIGCNVGRLSRDLALDCRKVYSLDLNFGVALMARRILVGWPRPIDGYELFREGFLSDRRPLNLEPRSNVEVLIASGLGLPFCDESVDVAASSSVLDVIPSPSGLLQEKRRVLRSGGLLGFACGYGWEMMVPLEEWLGGRDGKPAKEQVRACLAETFDVIGDVEHVPWVLRQSDRDWGLFLLHCLVGRKRTKDAAPAAH